MKSLSMNDIDQQLQGWKSCEKCQLHVFRTQVVYTLQNTALEVPAESLNVMQPRPHVLKHL